MKASVLNSLFQKITSQLPGMVYQYRLRPDGSSCFPYASDAISAVYRVTPDEVRHDASKVLAKLHPDDYDCVVKSIQDSAQDLSPWQHEYRVKFDDGTVRWLFGNARPEREADGATLWHGFITDITDRIKSQEQLHISHLALNSISQGVLISAPDGCVLSVNDAFLSITGYRESEVLGRTCGFVQGPRTDKSTVAALRLAQHNATEFKGDILNYRKDGKSFWNELSVSPVFNGAGQLIHFIGITRDITMRKEAQEAQEALHQQHLTLEQTVATRTAELTAALADSKVARELLHMALKGADAGCFEWNVETGETLWSNEVWALNGLAPQDGPANYATWLQTVHPNDLARLEQTTAAAVSCGAVVEVEWQVKLPPGAAPRWLMSRAHPLLQADGRVVRYRGIIIDITRRRLAELTLELHLKHLEELVAARTAALADAEMANRAKSDFLASMSHELRTPLNAVVGLAGLLLDSPLNRRQRDYADKIKLSAQALRALIDDILDFSKIEAGELQLEQAPFSLNAILRTTAAVVGVGLGHKPIEALFEVAPDVPDALVGDALRLQQILLNLTSNAVKFTSEGEIVLSVRRLPAKDGSQSATATLQFTLRDTGIGIADHQLGHIFEGFTQADTSTSRLYGGSGLGLAISARLATLMGGKIDVGSTLGQGSEFRLEVPLALGDNTPPATPECVPAALRILIVDDHPQARRVLTQTCAALGWQASAVDSGAAGLQALQRHAPEGGGYDLLLLDWHMPDMNGLEMLRQAQATPALGLPLVVLMASMAELEQAVVASDDLNLDGIVAKPLTPGSLLEAVIRAHTGEYSALLPPVHPSDRRLSGMRLLVAEDNLLNQDVVEQILTRAGADVVVVGDGLAVLAALRLHGDHFDAVLMDIQMPRMDGYTATRLIREELGLIDLPIIAVTAFARPQDREKTRLAGMVGHIAKPLDVDDLLDLLVAQRRGRVAATPLVGLDVVAALKTFGGDEKRYQYILRKFVMQHGGDVDEARRLCRVDERSHAMHLLHGLSGIASFLQARELARLASATEEAVRHQNASVLPLLFDELQAAMQTVKGDVQTYLTHADVDNSVAFSTDRNGPLKTTAWPPSGSN